MMVSEEYQLSHIVRSTQMTSFQDHMDMQKELLCLQIDELQNVVLAQCELTGLNPLSEEMAAGALSIRIGKRPRDLLNSKAVKYMQSVFSIKDAVSKKESRDIGGLLGLTATQVREFFTNQRSRVRKFTVLSREKAIRVAEVKEQQNGVLGSSESQMPINPVPLNTIAPLASEGPSCSTQPEAIGSNDLEKSFVEKIFVLMRIEETFSGQVKLLEWILQIENTMILLWFLNKGGVMILATWLSEAATEEQTSVLHAILKVLCHLPVNKALPVHMSAILQSVNRLRFYRASVISNRARILLARWSKVFARSRALRKVNGSKSVADVESEVLLKKSIEEIMDDESWEAQAIKEDALVPLSENPELRKLEPLKLLTSSTDDSNKKLCLGISSFQTKERRKVLLVEHPGQKLAGRSIQAARSTPNPKPQSRPLSADDIQKAKMRAHFLRNKYGKSVAASNDVPQAKAEDAPPKCSSSLVDTSVSESIPLIPLRTDEQKQPLPVMLPAKPPTQEVQNEDKLSLDPDEPQWKKRKRVQIPWLTPAEVRVNNAWRFGAGEDSKEVEVQTNRNRRERETIYSAIHEIPDNPKEPWDREMEYDDSLTPEIPSIQLPDNDVVETETAVTETTTGGAGMVNSRPSDLIEMMSALASAFALTSNSSSSNSRSSAEPDYDLLEVLLQTPDLVFALTSGQSGISNEETVRVLDMIKARRAAAAPAPDPDPIPSGLGRNVVVPVSLPSPTPSSEPVTNHWGGVEDTRNPFSSQTATFPPSNFYQQNQSGPFIAHQFDHLMNVNNNNIPAHNSNYRNAIMDRSEPLQHHQKPMPPTWQLQPQQPSWIPEHANHHGYEQVVQNRVDNVRTPLTHSGYAWERDDFNGVANYENNNNISSNNSNNIINRRNSQAEAEYNHRSVSGSGYSRDQPHHHHRRPEQGQPPSRTWASPDQQREYNNRYGDRRWHDGRR